jgi:BirA family biotin operon repressor/biotin-[acetyl-CoA-carboxylase] ligase
LQLDNFSFFYQTKISTNDLIRDYKKINGYAVSTNLQHNGRGQYSREFITQKGEAILTSLIFHKYYESDNFPYLIAGIIKNILQEYVTEKITLKLPNDLLINGQKIAGILIERDFSKKHYLIIGFGINIYGAPKINYPVSYLAKYSSIHLNKNEINFRIIEVIRKKVAK